MVVLNVFANPFGINRLDKFVEFNAATKRAKRSLNANKYCMSLYYFVVVFQSHVSSAVSLFARTAIMRKAAPFSTKVKKKRESWFDPRRGIISRKTSQTAN